jgi:hypothetical protein
VVLPRVGQSGQVQARAIQVEQALGRLAQQREPERVARAALRSEPTIRLRGLLAARSCGVGGSWAGIIRRPRSGGARARCPLRQRIRPMFPGSGFRSVSE